MKVSIIIPAYNEEERIGKTLDAYSNYFEEKRIKGFNYEIVIVINATTDRTEEIVKESKKKNARIRYLNLEKGGKGYAVVEGFKDALKRSNDLIGFVDADMATPPEAFYYLIKGINNYDGAIASRYIEGSEITPKLSFRRIFVARIFNFLVRGLFFMPYDDTQCGAKLFKKKAAESIVKDTAMSQWAFDVELLYKLKKKGYRVKEIPTIWKDILGSKLDVKKASIQMLLSIVQLRAVNSRFKRFLKPLRPIAGGLWRIVK